MDRAVLSRLSARARKRWPELGAVTAAELEAFISARIPAERFDETIRAEDLLLACACTRGAGARAAHDALHDLTAADIDRAHARIRPPITQQQARQLVWNRLLLIPEGGAARIALYMGDNELTAYVRGATNRMLLALASQTKAETAALEDAILHAPGNAALALEPELQRVKQTYLAGVRLTLAHTLTSLEPRERALLRYAIIEQLGARALGLMYGASWEAIAAEINTAREKLEYRVKNRLAERMRISDRDHATLARCVSTQLDAALARTHEG